MTNIFIFDTEAKELEKVAVINDVTIAEIIQALVLDYLEKVKEDNNWW